MMYLQPLSKARNLHWSTTMNQAPRQFSTILRRSSKWRLLVTHGYTINSRKSSIIWRARNWVTIHFQQLKYKQYERPESCDTLTPVKFNPPIWEKLKSKTKSSDLRFQKIQTAFNKSLIAMVQVTDCLTKLNHSRPMRRRKSVSLIHRIWSGK